MLAKAATSTQRWRDLRNELEEALRNFTSATGEQYVLGEDQQIDRLHESLWSLVLESAPEFVKITDDIPPEYIDQIEQDNAIREALEERVEEEREYLKYRHEKRSRRTRTFTFLATPR